MGGVGRPTPGALHTAVLPGVGLRPAWLLPALPTGSSQELPGRRDQILRSSPASMGQSSDGRWKHSALQAHPQCRSFQIGVLRGSPSGPRVGTSLPRDLWGAAAVGRAPLLGSACVLTLGPGKTSSLHRAGTGPGSPKAHGRLPLFRQQGVRVPQLSSSAPAFYPGMLAFSLCQLLLVI